MVHLGSCVNTEIVCLPFRSATMRLLDTETGQLVDYPDEGKVPAYAILAYMGSAR